MPHLLAALSLISRLVAIQPAAPPKPLAELGLSSAVRARVAG